MPTTDIARECADICITLHDRIPMPATFKCHTYPTHSQHNCRYLTWPRLNPACLQDARFLHVFRAELAANTYCLWDTMPNEQHNDLFDAIHFARKRAHPPTAAHTAHWLSPSMWQLINARAAIPAPHTQRPAVALPTRPDAFFSMDGTHSPRRKCRDATHAPCP